jgi:hypothetical protein
MKPPLFVPIHRGAKRFAIMLTMAAAMGLGAGVAFSQNQPSPGTYYQANPPGSGLNSGVTYNELAYVNSLITAPNTSIYDPLPPGDTAASASQIDTALATAVQNVIAGTVPAQYPGISLASLATQMVANQPVAATQQAMLGQIAASVIADSSSTTTAITNLNGVITGLAAAYPATFTTISQSIFTNAAANAGTAAQLSQLALTATTALSTNDKAVGAIVGQALSAAAGSSALNASQIQTAMTGVVSAQLSSTSINSSPASIAAISTSMTTSAVLTAVPLSTILNAAVTALPVADKAATTLGNVSVGAIAVGALISDSPAAATIMSTLANANSSTAAYTTMVVNGFNNSTGSTSAAAAAAYQAYVNANPAYADAIVMGATVQGLVSPATLITYALQAGSSVPIQNVVAAAISADLTRSSAGYYTNNPPVTPTDNAATIVDAAVAAYGISTTSSQGASTTAQLQAIALGAVGAARISDAGMITFSVISNSPGYTAPTGANGSLVAANVSGVVNSAITAAYSTKQTPVADAAVANIVYNAERASYNTSATLTTPVTAGITAMQTLDTESDVPTYIAAAAALAGYAGTTPGTALPMIASQAENTATGSTSMAAISAAEAIVNAIRPSSGGASGTYGVNITTAFPNTMTAFSANASSPDSVQAVLYAASLADPNDSSAFLAAAIAKTSSVPSSTLLADAINVSQVVTNTNETGNPVTGLTLVSTIATHIATNLISQNDSDINNFVGYQAAQNPSYVKDIATAAVTVDPYQSNYVARAIAYNSPTTAYQAIPQIFNYSQITTLPANAGRVTVTGGYIDPVSAAAAISAGYTTGIVEAAGSPTMNNTTTQAALSNGVAASVGSALTVLGTSLRGVTIQQSTGASTTAYTNSASVGAAGVITGFVSQVVEPTDTTKLGGTNTTLSSSGTTSTSIIDAVLTAAVKVPGASIYTLQMAQAAGQAYGYITGIIGMQSSSQWATNDASISSEIATDMTGYTASSTGTGKSLYTAAYNAAYFGTTQGQAGIPGAGATGVSANYVNGLSATYYNQNAGSMGTVTGAPVTNIFNL